MKLIYVSTGENIAGGASDGVLYFGAVHRVPCAVWESGGFEAWVLKNCAAPAIEGMEPVPGTAAECIEAYAPDTSGDLLVMWRTPYRKAALKAIGGVR